MCYNGVGGTMKNSLVKMNDGTRYLSLGNIFNIIKKNSINKSNALQTELFLIVFGIDEIGTTTVNNYCIGSRAIAMDYKKIFYALENDDDFQNRIIDIINILEDNVNVVQGDVLDFINSNELLYKVCLDINVLIDEDSNIGETRVQEFKDLLEMHDLYHFIVKVLSYAILENKQPILKQDISAFLKNKDLEEFISINLFEGFNYFSSLKRLAKKGNMYANVELGTIEFNLSVHGTSEYIESYNYYMEAALKDHPKACWMVAYMIMKRVVPFDMNTMMKFLNRALELGSIPAINMMGNLYYNGINEENVVDKDKARKYYEEAASLGYAYAYNNLGRMSLDEGNENAAMKYFKMSADLGESWALNKLGEYYRKKGKLEDAYFYYLESIKSHYYEKCYYAYYNLALYYYLDGVLELGINKDLDKALEYAKIAYENGIKEALKIIEKIEN